MFKNNSINKSYSSFRFLAWVLLFRIVIDLGYVLFVNKIYYYDGFNLDVVPIKLFESYLVMLLIAFFLPQSSAKPSIFLLNTYFIMVLVPLLSLYGLANKERWMLYILLIGYFTLHFLVVVMNLVRFRIKTIRGSNSFILVFLYFLTFVFLFHLALSGGYKYFNLDLSQVYKLRDSVTETVYSGGWGYFTNWVVKVVNLTLAAWFLYKRNWLFFAICVLLQVFYFGVTSHKTNLFLILLIPAFYFLFRSANPVKLMLQGIIFVLCITIVVAYYTDNIFLGSLIIRRLFFVPANLSYVYIEFFSTNPHVYMSNSITSVFINYPYTLSTANTIGSYLGQPGMSANNGVIASGFMHFNIFGVVFFAFIVGMILWLLDAVSTRLPSWLCLSVVIGPIMSLFTSADLGTTLLTHGLALALIILYFLSGIETKKLGESNEL